MAVLHRKEEKIQAVLGRLPKKYNSDEFFAMFIKLYSKDWGKIKSAYIKASQDKEPGTVINMPKPDLYLKQVLEAFLTQQYNAPQPAAKQEIIEEKLAPAEVVKVEKVNEAKIDTESPKAKASVKKVATKEKTTVDEKPIAKVKKVAVPKVDPEAPDAAEKIAKAKASVKKVVTKGETTVEKESVTKAKKVTKPKVDPEAPKPRTAAKKKAV